MRKLILLAMLVLAGLGAWQFASPWIALDSLRDAAREADREALSERIDFPALRESLKVRMRKEIGEEAKRRGVPGGLAKVGGDLVANGFVDQVVDGTITPDGMAALLVTGSLVPQRTGVQAKEIDWEVDREGLTRFRAYPKGEDGQAYPSLLFVRSGLSWKLVALDIPERQNPGA